MRLIESARYEQLRATGSLPSPHGMALAIVKLLAREDYEVGEVARLVKSDPAIAGRVLKFVNSADMRRGRAIASLGSAIIILGASRIRNLVLAFSLLDGPRSGGCAAFDYERYWSRALATAIAAQALSKYARVPADEIFTAGLLCDVGELALASLFPERYVVVLLAADGDAVRLLDAERAAFATDHRELGASMLAEWGVPQYLAAAAYYCEAPDAAGEPAGSRIQRLSLALNFAKALAEICVADGDERESALPELYGKAASLGVRADDMGAMVDGIVASWREWGQTLQVMTRELPSFADLLTALPSSSAEPPARKRMEN